MSSFPQGAEESGWVDLLNKKLETDSFVMGMVERAARVVADELEAARRAVFETVSLPSEVAKRNTAGPGLARSTGFARCETALTGIQNAESPKCGKPSVERHKTFRARGFQIVLG